MFKSKKFYCVSFLSCLILALLIKFSRDKYFGVNEVLDVSLGSAPSFLYLFGLICCVPLLKKNIEIAAYKKTAWGCTLGALAYEAEQIWTSRQFDLNDVLATILALILFLVIHKNVQSKT